MRKRRTELKEKKSKARGKEKLERAINAPLEPLPCDGNGFWNSVLCEPNARLRALLVQKRIEGEI